MASGKSGRRRKGLSCLVLWVPAWLGSWAGLQSQQEPPAIRTSSEAVIVDVVVRDRRGRAVRDLRRDEIEVYENGVLQEIVYFRHAPGADREALQGPADPIPRRGQLQPAGPRSEALPQLNLVTLIFERLGLEERQLAYQAAQDFLELGLSESTYVAVFAIDQRLYVLQPFTQERERLEGAIRRATSGAYSQFASESDAIRNELENFTALSTRAGVEASQLGQTSQPSAGLGSSFAEARMAEITLNTLRFAENLQRDQQGHSSLHALLSVVREQRRLAGRKTVLYFSTGLHVPPGLVDLLRSAINEANRANVSFYAVDARGLGTQALSLQARDMLQQAADASRRQQLSGGGRAVTREEVMIGESAEASIRMNTQQTLADLSESTGGFLLANTNNFRRGIERLSEDIHTYYEIAYLPRELKYDGSFRAITVKVRREDVTVQARSGYFDLPGGDYGPTLPYEVPLLAALAAPQPPDALPFRAKAFRFHPTPLGVTHTLVMEVPLENILFQLDEKRRTYSTRFSLLALIKDAEGQILQKFSQDYPLEGPGERLEALRQGNVVFLRNFKLAPGRYRLETAVYDHGSQKSGAHRAFLFVPGEQLGVGLSSLSVVRRADPLPEEEKDGESPFHYQDLKLIPNLGVPIRPEETALSLYLVVYPQPQLPDPSLIIEILKDGQVVGQARPDLPGRQGERIPFLASLPLQGFSPGRYEVRVFAVQGDSAVKEHAFFILDQEL